LYYNAWSLLAIATFLLFFYDMGTRLLLENVSVSRWKRIIGQKKLVIIDGSAAHREYRPEA